MWNHIPHKEETFICCLVNAFGWRMPFLHWDWTSRIGPPCRIPKTYLQHNTCPGWDHWPGGGCQCSRRKRVHWTHKPRGSYQHPLCRYEQNEVETGREHRWRDWTAADRCWCYSGDETFWIFWWLTDNASIEDSSHALLWMLRWNGLVQRDQKIWSNNRLCTRIFSMIVSPKTVCHLQRQGHDTNGRDFAKW